jgi:hypothetical protein
MFVKGDSGKRRDGEAVKEATARFLYSPVVRVQSV